MLADNEYADHARAMERKYNLHAGTLDHLIRAESGGDFNALSGKGAIGLTQLMPKTAEDLGVDPRDPFQNIEGGAKYLREQLDRYNQSYPQALAAYNGGPNRRAVRERDWDALPTETKEYVEKFHDFLFSIPAEEEPTPRQEVESFTKRQEAESGESIIDRIEAGLTSGRKEWWEDVEDSPVKESATMVVAGPVATMAAVAVPGAIGRGAASIAKGASKARKIAGVVKDKLGKENIKDVTKDVAVDFVFDNLPKDVPASLSALRALRNLMKGKISAKEAVKEGVTDAAVDWVLKNLPVNIPGGATTIKIALKAFRKDKAGSPVDDILSTVKKDQ